MVKKLLEELLMDEIKTVLKFSGIEGVYSESEWLVRLTVYLVTIREDPFTFQFETDEHLHEVVEENVPEGNEVLKELCATMSGSGQVATMSGSGQFGTIETSVSRMNSVVSAECSSEAVSASSPTFVDSFRTSTFSVPCDVSRRVSTGTSFSADLVKAEHIFSSISVLFMESSPWHFLSSWPNS